MVALTITSTPMYGRIIVLTNAMSIWTAVCAGLRLNAVNFSANKICEVCPIPRCWVTWVGYSFTAMAESAMLDFMQIVSPVRPGLKKLLRKLYGASLPKTGLSADIVSGKVELTVAQIRELSVKVFLQEVGLCNPNKKCRCNSVLRNVALYGEHFVFRCSKCKTRVSLYSGLYLENLKLPVWKIIGVFYWMCGWRNYTQRLIAAQLGVSENTISQHCVWVREVLATFMRLNLVTMGGPGKYVAVDEVWIGTKRKYNRGSKNRGLKVPGTVDEKVLLLVMRAIGERKVVVYQIAAASIAEISPAVCKHVLEGTTIYTDGLPSYLSLPEWGGKNYKHAAVNHSAGEYARMGPDGIVISSNAVEGENQKLKNFLRAHSGFQYNFVFLALDEYVFRANFTEGPVADLQSLARTLGEYSQMDINGTDENPAVGHSLHYEHLHEWTKQCSCNANYVWECTCHSAEEESSEPSEESGEPSE